MQIAISDTDFIKAIHHKLDANVTINNFIIKRQKKPDTRSGSNKVIL